jgi:hypothetical protein
VDYLHRYLSYVPEDSDALARYGLLLDKSAESPRARSRALDVLQQAVRREPGRRDVRREVVRIALDLRRFGVAREHEAERRLGRRVELRTARAAIWSARGGPEARSSLAELELELESFAGENQVRLLRALAGAYVRTGNLTKPATAASRDRSSRAGRAWSSPAIPRMASGCTSRCRCIPARRG